MPEPASESAKETTQAPAAVFEPASPPYPSVLQGLGLVGLVMVLQFAVMAGILLAAMLYRALAHPGLRPDELMRAAPTLDPLALAVVSFVSVGSAVALGARLAGRPYRRSFPMAAVRLRLFVPMALSLAGGVFLLQEAQKGLLRLLPMPAWFQDAFASLVGGEVSVAGSVLALVVIAPVTEELLFRGVILSGFLRRYSPARAIGASALLFGVVHGNPWQFVDAVVLGALFGWWAFRTRSLLPSLLGHVAVNGAAMAAALGSRAGAAVSTAPFAPLWMDMGALLLAAAGIRLTGRWFTDRA